MYKTYEILLIKWQRDYLIDQSNGRGCQAVTCYYGSSSGTGGITLDSFLHSPLMVVISFFATYLYVGCGITLGYHRLLTHKSLSVPKWLEYFIVLGGYLCLMGSPIVWVAVHRLHHLKSDQKGDPHTPRDGFKHALYEWMFQMSDYQTDEEVKRVTPDLCQDPLYKHLGQSHQPAQALLCLAVNVLFRVPVLVFCGWPALVANVVATVTVFWATQFVNTFCHMDNQGYRTFNTREDSRNVWWVGILACGEGWHNNHHAMPKSARHGMTWKEFDVTWCYIWTLEKLGLAKAVVRPNPTVAKAKRLSPVPHNIVLYSTKVPASIPSELEDYNETMLVGVGTHAHAHAHQQQAAASASN